MSNQKIKSDKSLSPPRERTELLCIRNSMCIGIQLCDWDVVANWPFLSFPNAASAAEYDMIHDMIRCVGGGGGICLLSPEESNYGSKDARGRRKIRATL